MPFELEVELGDPEVPEEPGRKVAPLVGAPAAPIPVAGLVGYWSFDGGNGNDFSGHGGGLRKIASVARSRHAYLK